MSKLVMSMAVAILCVNLSIFLVNEYDILDEVEFMTPITPGGIKDKVDINGTITPETSFITEFYNLWGGASRLYRLITTLVAGIPGLLNEFGTPPAIALVLDAIYTFILGVFFIEIITGRDILD